MSKKVQICLIVVFGDIFYFGNKVAALPLSPCCKTNTTCYGLGHENVFDMNCGSGKVIAIHTITFGTKMESVGCPQYWNASHDPTCCEMSQDDCLIFNSSKNENFYNNCNGKESCTGQRADWDETPTVCDNDIQGDTHNQNSNYMFIHYDCINETRIYDIFSASGVTEVVDSGTVYIWSEDYPNEIKQSAVDEMACSVEADNCDSNIEIFTLDISLFSNSNGICEQYLKIRDAGNNTVNDWSCSDNTVDIVSSSVPNYAIVYFSKNNTDIGGRFLIGLQATESSNITVSCPPEYPTMCERTTTSTSSTMTSQTTSSTTTSPTTTSTTNPQTTTSTTNSPTTTSTTSSPTTTSTMTTETTATTTNSPTTPSITTTSTTSSTMNSPSTTSTMTTSTTNSPSTTSTITTSTTTSTTNSSTTTSTTTTPDTSSNMTSSTSTLIKTTSVTASAMKSPSTTSTTITQSSTSTKSDTNSSFNTITKSSFQEWGPIVTGVIAGLIVIVIIVLIILMCRNFGICRSQKQVQSKVIEDDARNEKELSPKVELISEVESRISSNSDPTKIPHEISNDNQKSNSTHTKYAEKEEKEGRVVTKGSKKENTYFKNEFQPNSKGGDKEIVTSNEKKSKSPTTTTNDYTQKNSNLPSKEQNVHNDLTVNVATNSKTYAKCLENEAISKHKKEILPKHSPRYPKQNINKVPKQTSVQMSAVRHDSAKAVERSKLVSGKKSCKSMNRRSSHRGHSQYKSKSTTSQGRSYPRPYHHSSSSKSDSADKSDNEYDNEDNIQELNYKNLNPQKVKDISFNRKKANVFHRIWHSKKKHNRIRPVHLSIRNQRPVKHKNQPFSSLDKDIKCLIGIIANYDRNTTSSPVSNDKGLFRSIAMSDLSRLEKREKRVVKRHSKPSVRHSMGNNRNNDISYDEDIVDRLPRLKPYSRRSHRRQHQNSI